jgi:hypothetical protein
MPSTTIARQVHRGRRRSGIRRDVEDTGNDDLGARVLIPVEHTIPRAVHTLCHHAAGRCLTTC